MKSKIISVAAALPLALSAFCSQSRADQFTPAQLAERTLQRRAVEVAIWGMPIVASDAIRQGFLRDIGADFNDIAYLSKFADWKFQTTTPNASTYYFYSAYDVKAGPVVMEVPAAVGAGIYGQLCDIWGAPLAIVGPGGDDKGAGGKYLILAPDYKGEVPTDYFPIRQQTYGGFWLMRTIPKSTSQADLDAATALLKTFRMYPLSQAGSAPPQRFVDASGKLWDGIPRMDESFYAVLAKMVNEEPVNARDLAMMNMLRSLGIEKGRKFEPDAATTGILRKAITEAKAFMQNEILEATGPFWDNSRWALPDTAGVKTQFSYLNADMLDYDGRAAAYFFAWAPPMKQDASAPTIYLQNFYTSTGQPLTGDKNFRLRVPPNVPAKQYWSATVYDFDTAGFVREAPVVSLDSFNQKTIKNADGSIDIYFAPSPPSGQENNWVATKKGGTWFVTLRLYGPDKAFFDKSWKLPDLEEVR